MSFSYFRIIRLNDTDGAGVVYFSNLLSICHEAYEDYLTSSCLNFQDLVYHSSIALPIVHGEIDFFKPIHCGDRICIDVIPNVIKTSEFEIIYHIYYELEPNINLAKAKTRHVCINKNTRKRVDLPAIITNCLNIL